MVNGNLPEICKWLSFYVMETCSCKAEAYPPKSLYQLLSGLLRHLSEILMTQTFWTKLIMFMNICLKY